VIPGSGHLGDEQGWPAPGGPQTARASWSPPPPVRTNGFAIASLVLGILWLYWIGSIVALVLGYIALRQIRRSNGWQDGRGLAIAGVVLGWVGVAVLVVAVLLLAAASDEVDDALDEPTVTAPDDPTATSAPDASEALSPSPSYTDPALAETVLSREPPLPEPPPADTAADALAARTLIAGEGDEAQAGDTVVVHYVGVLSDGSQFDASWSCCPPFPVTLGEGAVIAGWDEGLVGVRVGERRHLVIGSGNAYGATGAGEIPPGAALAFDVDVVDIQRGP
jgi:hypothetical protein